MNAPAERERPLPRRVSAAQRVRVTAPPRRRKSAPVTRTHEIDEGTELGEVLLGSLMRDQRRLALSVLGVLALCFLPLPLLLQLPLFTEHGIRGLPWSWVILGALPFGVLWLLGWWYVRRAEATERAFAELMGTDEP